MDFSWPCRRIGLGLGALPLKDSILQGMNDSMFDVRELVTNLTDSSDMAVGHMLTDLPSFSDAVQLIRAQLSLTNVTELHDNPTIEEITAPYNRLSAQDKQTLNTWAKDLISKYRLSKQWYKPFKMVALTNTLFVPHDEPIGFQESNIDATHSVAMYFSYKTSANEARLYISQHFDELEQMMSALPERPQSSMEPHTFTIGRLCYWARRETPRPSWARIAESVNESIEEQGIGVTVLDPQSAHIYADRYELRLRRLDPEI
jgi:hypothetical protein